MELTFRIDETKVTKTFNNLARGLSSFQKPFTKAGDDLLRFYGVEVFDSQGRESGERWRQLAASTLLAREQRKGYYRNPPIAINKILVWTGRLQKGFEKQVTPKRLRIFNDVPYFKYHQKAGGRPAQRKMLAITSKVIDKVVKRVLEHVEDAIES